MTNWLFDTFPVTAQYPILIGTLLIVLTSILFLWRIEAMAKSLKSTGKIGKDETSAILSKILFPLCTALPNAAFAFAALTSEGKTYLVITSNIGNNVTNITFFTALIMLIGYLKGDTMSKKEAGIFRQEFNFLLLSTLIFFFCLFDGVLTRHEGAILTACFFYSMTDIFQFRLSDIRLLVQVGLRIAPFFAVAGVVIFVGSELVIHALSDMGDSINSRIYEVLLPGFILVLPSVLPLLLALVKPDMQKLALGGIVGDCAFSVPLIAGLVACFSDEIRIGQELVSYMGITSAVAFGAFMIAVGGKEKISLKHIAAPMIGYVIILVLSAN